MSEDVGTLITSVVIAVVTGIASSYLFWLWLTRGLAPQIRWSRLISKNDRWPGGPTKYRVKIMNLGRRGAVDFSATCMLRVPHAATGDNVKLVHLRTLDVPLPRLGPGKGRIITIKTDGLAPEHVSGLPESLRGYFNQDPPTPLETVLRDFPGSEVVLYLSAYDEVSGSRKHFRSAPYTIDSITRAQFRADGVDIEDKGPV